MSKIKLFYGDNLDILKRLSSETIDLIYIDPPFNTGKIQKRISIKTEANSTGDRIGFQGKSYKTIKLGSKSYSDIFDDYIEFIEPRLIEAHRLLKPNGSLFFHINTQESHYCKILLDIIFGRESFINEIVWAYDYGARSKTRWPKKHDTIFWYAKNQNDYTFNLEECDHIPYMAPSLVGAEKTTLGKTPTDTWWHTIVGTNSHEKTGYPTQKPRGIIDRIVKVHSNPEDLLLDFFAGSGTLGASAKCLNRNCYLIDSNPEAIEIIQLRLNIQAIEL